MRYIRTLLLVTAVVAVLGIGGWFLIGWTVNRAFESATQKGGLQKLFNVVEASVGSTLAHGEVRLQPGKADGEGALAFYQKNPEALRRDKKYFETWSTALAIADASLKSDDHRLGRWESSMGAPWITPQQESDSWGHAFCVQSDQQRTIVVSPGPRALSSLDCSSLKLPEDELAQMPQARLNPSLSGALIMVVKSK